MKKLLIIAVAAMAIFAMSVPAMAVSPSTYTFEMAARMLTDIGWQSAKVKSSPKTRAAKSAPGS